MPIFRYITIFAFFFSGVSCTSIDVPCKSEWKFKHLGEYEFEVYYLNNSDRDVTIDKGVVYLSFKVYDKDGNQLPTLPVSLYEVSDDTSVQVPANHIFHQKVDLREGYEDSVIATLKSSDATIIFDYGFCIVGQKDKIESFDMPLTVMSPKE